MLESAYLGRIVCQQPHLIHPERAQDCCGMGVIALVVAEAKPVGRKLVRKIIAACSCPAIALGGMHARNVASAEKDGFYGWAAIDAWLRI